MSVKWHDCFDPQAAARLGKLRLLARSAVEGFITGLHRSPHRGFAVEFAEHREYTPGDEIRHLDWHAWARSDRYYIKLYEQQTNLRCQILLDSSNSMAYTSGQVTKFQYARYLAALLGYLMIHQQDNVGITVFDDMIRHHIPPGTGARHMERIFQTLETTQAANATGIGQTIHEMVPKLRKRGLVIILSDLLDQPEHVITALRHLRYRKHQVIIFHIMDPAELQFPFNKLATFVDMETGQRIKIDPKSIRGQYLRALEQFLAGYRRACAEARIEYVLANTARNYDLVLREYLATRRRLR